MQISYALGISPSKPKRIAWEFVNLHQTWTKGGKRFYIVRSDDKSAAQFALKISRKKYNDTIVYT